MAAAGSQAVVSQAHIDAFAQTGYLKIPSFIDKDTLSALQAQAQYDRAHPTAPMELEAETGYPGAPISPGASGGHTPRRLLQAYQRHSLYRQWARHPTVKQVLSAMFSGRALVLSQAHHNCLMTKTPEFSSDTGWHQDIRYWSFSSTELISVWLALGAEHYDNGALRIIPGSHRAVFDAARFDQRKFFREDLPENQAVIASSTTVELDAGDVLFFHGRLLHSATRNYTEQTKLSLVFTYHDEHTVPLAGSRSAAIEEVRL